MSTKYPFKNPDVERVFNGFPQYEKRGLLELRESIFLTADTTNGVGDIEETLKWNQPAYLTPQTKSGSTIRLGLSKQSGFAIYTHCQTTIMSDFQHLFPDGFNYERNRAIHFAPHAILPLNKLELLVRAALTYHL